MKTKLLRRLRKEVKYRFEYKVHQTSSGFNRWTEIRLHVCFLDRQQYKEYTTYTHNTMYGICCSEIVKMFLLDWLRHGTAIGEYESILVRWARRRQKREYYQELKSFQ